MRTYQLLRTKVQFQFFIDFFLAATCSTINHSASNRERKTGRVSKAIRIFALYSKNLCPYEKKNKKKKTFLYLNFTVHRESQIVLQLVLKKMYQRRLGSKNRTTGTYSTHNEYFYLMEISFRPKLRFLES